MFDHVSPNPLDRALLLRVRSERSANVKDLTICVRDDDVCTITVKLRGKPLRRRLRLRGTRVRQHLPCACAFAGWSDHVHSDRLAVVLPSGRVTKRAARADQAKAVADVEP